MLVKSDLGFRSSVFIVVIVVVIVVFVRRKWRQSVVRSEEVQRLLVSAFQESARVEFESYYYTSNVTPSVSTPAYTPVQLDSPVKPRYQCAVCFSSTTTRCATCKAVRYCSQKCQIVDWRHGHKDECRPYVAVSPSNNVGGSSYKQGDLKHHSDGFNSEVKQTATLSGRSSENSHYKDDVGIESLSHQQSSNPISESEPPLLYEGYSGFSTPNAFSADVTVENLEKSTDLGDNNHKISNLSDEETQSGTSSSSFWTDDGSNESSLPEPSKDSSGFWDQTIRNKKLNSLKHDDLVLDGVGEAANSYTANHTINGFSAAKVIIPVLPGLGSKKSNDITDSSKDIVNDGSMPPTCTSDITSDLPASTIRESKKFPSGTASHDVSAAALCSSLKDDKALGGLPSVSEKSNDVLSNKSTVSNTSKSGDAVSSLSKASDTLTTFTSRHTFHCTKPMKVVNNETHMVTSPSQLTENSHSGLKTFKLKVADHLKTSMLSRQESLEGGNETIHRYSFKGLFPYEMFVKLYNWKQVELQPCGLKNCGNSCYANAVLQCLVYTPPLTAYLLEGLHSKACDKRGWCFTCEFEGLVMKAKDGNSSLSPIHLLTHIENTGSNLGHGKEEDAHEYLRYVIEALQSVCIKEARTKSLNSLEEETTLIGLTFGGYLRSKITCMKCGGKSERHERMMDLTVEIEGDINTLEEALDKFTCTEILDGENKYRCIRCKSYEKAKKRLTLLEAPNVLTIALKRFQSGKYGKLNKTVHFPEILDMAPYVSGTSDKSPIYRLYGVVVHVDTMNAAFSGHYVCYVKNLQNRWFKFDDTVVKEVDLQHVLTKGAYMLLYSRCSPRAPRSIRSSLIHDHDQRKHIIPPSRCHSTGAWDACSYEAQVSHRSVEEESSSSGDNSEFFSESCSCSTDGCTHRDSNTIESGDYWEQDYWKNMSLNSSDSDTSSTSSFPSPLYSKHSHLYTLRTNGGGELRHKVCRNLNCSCNCCRLTNLDSLGGGGGQATKKSSRGKSD